VVWEGVVERLGELMCGGLGESVSDHSLSSRACSIGASQHNQTAGLEELGGEVRGGEGSLKVHLVHLLDGGQKFVRLALQTATGPSSRSTQHRIIDTSSFPAKDKTDIQQPTNRTRFGDRTGR